LGKGPGVGVCNRRWSTFATPPANRITTMNWNESLLSDCHRLFLRFSDAAGFIPSCVSKKINQMVKKQTINLLYTRFPGEF
jgi:hypothetical protein